MKGQQLHEEFVKQRIIQCTIPLTLPIIKNNILLPSNSAKHEQSEFVCPSEKEDQKLPTALKIIAPIWKEATIKAMEYEPGNVPSVFTLKGKLFQSSKSYLLGRPKLLNTEPNLTDSNTPLDSDIRAAFLNQLIVDLTFLTVKLAYQLSTNNLRTFSTKSGVTFLDWDHIQEWIL